MYDDFQQGNLRTQLLDFGQNKVRGEKSVHTNLFKEVFQITQAEEFFDEGVHSERFKVLNVLTRTDEDYGTVGGSHCTQGTTAYNAIIFLLKFSYIFPD